MKNKIAINLGKTASLASQLLKRGKGNTIAGKVARKIDKDVLKNLAKQVENIIFITGTNGKTTTSNLLATMLKQDNKSYIHNEAGDNLIPGITSCFLSSADIKGEIHADYAIIEVDEAAIIHALKEITPKAIIINNFFRDQLDRFGEIETLIQNIQEAIRPVDTKLILNTDDPFTTRFSTLKKETVYFGLEKKAYAFDSFGISESKYCPHCGKELEYSYVHYGQLGFFECSCGFKRNEAHYKVTDIKNEHNITFKVNDESFEMKLPGVYNVYNALAAISCAKEFGVSTEAIKSALLVFESNNGRMQRFTLKDKKHVVNLVKNPAGVNSTISEILASPTKEKQVTLFLNDFESDGLDISWIWDADFERLNREDIVSFVCSGTRAHDLAIRLKYADIDEKKITIMVDKESALKTSFRNNLETYYLPNYTALRPVLDFLESKKDA